MGSPLPPAIVSSHFLYSSRFPHAKFGYLWCRMMVYSRRLPELSPAATNRNWYRKEVLENPRRHVRDKKYRRVNGRKNEQSQVGHVLVWVWGCVTKRAEDSGEDVLWYPILRHCPDLNLRIGWYFIMFSHYSSISVFIVIVCSEFHLCAGRKCKNVSGLYSFTHSESIRFGRGCWTNIFHSPRSGIRPLDCSARIRFECGSVSDQNRSIPGWDFLRGNRFLKHFQHIVADS